MKQQRRLGTMVAWALGVLGACPATEAMRQLLEESPDGQERVILPAELKTLHASLFANHFAPFSVTFDQGSRFTEIETHLFAYSRIQSVILPASVEVLEASCFAHCPSLISVMFEAGSYLTIIRENVFQDSTLQSIVIPARVEVMGARCFSGCHSLATVVFEADSRLARLEEGVFWSSSLPSLTLPASVEVMAEKCFQFCQSLAALAFETDSRLRSIEADAFAYSGLPSITLPRSVEMLGVGCFRYCRSLVSLVVEEDSRLGDVGSEAFAGTLLTSIDFPGGVALGDCVFQDSCIREIYLGGALVDTSSDAYAGAKMLQKPKVRQDAPPPKPSEEGRLQAQFLLSQIQAQDPASPMDTKEMLKELSPLVQMRNLEDLNNALASSSSGVSVHSEMHLRQQGGLQRTDQPLGLALDGTGPFQSAKEGLLGKSAGLSLQDWSLPQGGQGMETGDGSHDAIPASGAFRTGVSGEGGLSIIASGTLERSPTDLAHELSEMIRAQYAASTKVLSTLDDMLDMCNVSDAPNA
ncbi:MAG: leucine-rich repeat protein [Holosporales bacterium]|jgi:hypothetical protein|nr:leucine-rich repeat protein [Holosporales bacterium]